MICSSLTICLRTSFFASTWMTWGYRFSHLTPKHATWFRTFLAIITFVAACITLLTVPPLPAPSSFKTMRSSLRKSNLNSTPISKVSVLPTSFPSAPGICASPAEGTAFFADGVNARFLVFLRLKVRDFLSSDMATELSLSLAKCTRLEVCVRDGFVVRAACNSICQDVRSSEADQSAQQIRSIRRKGRRF